MDLHKLVAEHCVQALEDLFDTNVELSQIQVQDTNAEFDGEKTIVVFPFLRFSKLSPEVTGKKIGEYLSDNFKIYKEFNVVKGFLNLSFTDALFQDYFKAIYNQELKDKPTSEHTVMVEYASPNTNKPLHLGHLRNVFLGHAVSHILRADGKKVVKTQIINDRGIHICKSMVAWQQAGNGETPESTGMKGDHFIGKYYVKFNDIFKAEVEDLVKKGIEEKEAEEQSEIMKAARACLKKWENGDEETVALWKRMNSWVYKGFDATYDTLGITFDENYYESDTYILGKSVVEKGLADGDFYKKEDGSIWVDLSSENIDDKLLLRADGTSVYMTQDIGTAIERYKNHPNLEGIIYTVGNEQNHHFKVLFKILNKLGYKWADNCYHLSYGMVELPEGKMKSREGTVVDADDLAESVIKDAREMTEERGHIQSMSEENKAKLFSTIGLGGLKYYLLKVDAKQKILFDPKESIDLNGNTAPFIQYAHARISSLIEQAEGADLIHFSAENITNQEKQLILSLGEWQETVGKAASKYAPSLVCNYIYDLVKQYNSFYQSHPIFKDATEEEKVFRLAISVKTKEVIAYLMNLLGIDSPEKM